MRYQKEGTVLEKRTQGKFNLEEKYRFLQEDEYGNMGINEVCLRYGISTVTYYLWRNQVQDAMNNGLSDKQPESKYKALELIEKWVNYYNNQRLYAALRYLRPIYYLNGTAEEKYHIRRDKLKKAAKDRRKCNRNLYNQIVKDQKEIA